jgi:hypothetical protein
MLNKRWFQRNPLSNIPCIKRAIIGYMITLRLKARLG